MYEPGAIKHLDRYKQLISYVGLERLRGITPTDIDTFIDYNGRAFVYGDAKLKGKDIDIGQRIAFQNICKAHAKAGIPCVVFLYEHDTQPDQIIIAKDCIVSGFYWKGEWLLGVDQTLGWHIEKFEQYCIKKGIKL